MKAKSALRWCKVVLGVLLGRWRRVQEKRSLKQSLRWPRGDLEKVQEPVRVETGVLDRPGSLSPNLDADG